MLIGVGGSFTGAGIRSHLDSSFARVAAAMAGCGPKQTARNFRSGVLMRAPRCRRHAEQVADNNGEAKLAQEGRVDAGLIILYTAAAKVHGPRAAPLAQKTGVPGTENGEFFRKPPSPKSMPAAHSMERSTPLGAQARIQCSLPPALARAAPPTPGYYIL